MKRGAIEGRVRDLGHEGDAVVETERGLVLASGALPGERVALSNVARTGGVTRARELRVLEPSAEREEPACALALRCGGCPLMIASEALEAAHKVARIERALAAIPRGELPPLTLEHAGDRVGYRRRARLAFHGRTLGYRARRERRVVDVPRCVVLRPELEAALALARAELASRWEGEGELHLALGPAGLPVMALITEQPQPPALYEAFRAAVAGSAIAGASLAIGGASPVILGDAVEVSEDPEGRALRGPVPGFSQANADVNRALGRAAIALAACEGARVLELYAGCGNLTLGLAARASSLVAIELSPAAAAACRENLEAHGLVAEVRAGDAAASLPDADVVVLDPPRTGAREAVRAIASGRASRVVYVSCDPATLARDLAVLAEAGFVLDALRAFDMFPRTAHVEALASLRRLEPRAKKG